MLPIETSSYSSALSKLNNPSDCDFSGKDVQLCVIGKGGNRDTISMKKCGSLSEYTKFVHFRCIRPSEGGSLLA